jgi:hypothetical protein
MDDFLPMTSASVVADIKRIKEEIGNIYVIKELGRAEYFLGINLEYNSGSIKLSQSAYIMKILERFRMELCNPVVSPMIPNSFSLLSEDCTNQEYENMLHIPYPEAVGALMFLSVCTRPDIAVAMSRSTISVWHVFTGCYLSRK